MKTKIHYIISRVISSSDPLSFSHLLAFASLVSKFLFGFLNNYGKDPFWSKQQTSNLVFFHSGCNSKNSITTRSFWSVFAKQIPIMYLIFRFRFLPLLIAGKITMRKMRHIYKNKVVITYPNFIANKFVWFYFSRQMYNRSFDTWLCANMSF